MASAIRATDSHQCESCGVFCSILVYFLFFALNFAHLARCAAAILARAADERVRVPCPALPDFPATPLNASIALSNFARSAFNCSTIAPKSAISYSLSYPGKNLLACCSIIRLALSRFRAVRPFYERTHEDCRMIYDQLLSPKEMQTPCSNMEPTLVAVMRMNHGTLTRLYEALSLNDGQTVKVALVVHRRAAFAVPTLCQEAFFVNEFPIVCRSVIIPENGVAANDTLHRRIEFLHRGRDEQWHGGMTLLFRGTI
jgi:hypothetical protein